MFCGDRAISHYNPSLFFCDYLSGFGFKPVQDDFQQDFARITDEAHGYVFLAEL